MHDHWLFGGWVEEKMSAQGTLDPLFPSSHRLGTPPLGHFHPPYPPGSLRLLGREAFLENMIACVLNFYFHICYCLL